MNSFRLGLPIVGCRFPSLAPFPRLKAAIDEVEGNVKSPHELIFFSALTAISTVVQGIVDVKKPTGQCAPTSLLLLLVADSGERKTSTENIFLDPIREFQREQDIKWKNALSSWEVKKDIWDSKKKEIMRGVARCVRAGEDALPLELSAFEHEKEKPARPKRFKILYDDVTSEALMWGLYQDIPTAGMISSEASLKNRAFNDIPKQNSLWSGDPIVVDRKIKESFELRNARLTVSFMTQPVSLESYVAIHGAQLRGSGLWARFLVSQPISTQGNRGIDSSTVSWQHRQDFSARIKELLEENVIFLETPGAVRRTIGFAPDAADLWVEVFNEIEEEIRPGGRFEGAGDLASKMADNISRVAALIHVFEGVGGEISWEALRFSIDFCSWCSDEFYRIFMPPKESEVNARKLLNWFDGLRSEGFLEVKKNDILIYGPRKVRLKEKLQPALDELILAGDVSVFKDQGTWVVDISKVGPRF